tara:strand:+ start:175 stop:561 length:387 start_codon:yes stop_codon:yes gene_type:complete
MDMNSLLESLYEEKTSGEGHEKTAESAMFSGLASSTQENPFMDLSTEDLIKMAQEIENAEVDLPQEEDGDLEKTAFDMLGGQIMAHAMVHEFGLMKEAMATGYCRVCKENAMDLEGSSICAECLGSDN